MFINQFFILFFYSLGFANAQTLPDVQNASALEHKISLNAWHKTKSFLDNIGISSNSRPKIIFRDDINIDGNNGYGYFDSDRNEIHFIHFPSQILAFNGLPWSEQMMESFMIHEIAHSIFVSYMGEKEGEISRSWHEAVAYFVQFSLMDANLKTTIMEKMNFPAPYTNALSINDINYSASPNEFSISVYLYFNAQQDSELIKKIADVKVVEAMKNFFF